MHHIAALSAGITGAESGSARLYKRGTTTRAQYYADFEGTVAVSATTDISLDQFGSAEVYVDRLVDVRVFDANGESVREFTAGDSAPNVEVKSVSFTGADYQTAATGASKPTTLAAVLDEWIESAGALDWKVLLNGSSVNLTVLAGILTGLFYNVKSEAYGAIGDGIADDTAAIQAAMTAASAASGGIVVFPPGSYRITAALAVPAKVAVWGVDAASCTLQMDHATNSHMTFATDTSEQVIRNLSFTHTQNWDGRIIEVGVAARLAFEGCLFGSTFTRGWAVTISHASAWVRVENCSFRCQTVNNREFFSVISVSKLRIVGCLFILPAVVGAAAVISLAVPAEIDAVIRDCVFNYDSVVTFSAGHDVISVSYSTGYFGCFGNLVTEPGANLSSFLSASPFDAAAVSLCESDNIIGDSNSAHWAAYFVWTATNVDARRGELGSRKFYPASLAFPAGTTIFDAASHEWIHLPILGAGARTVKLTEPPVGGDIYVIINNRHVAGVSVTFTGNNIPIQMVNPVATLAAGTFWAYHFRVTKDDTGVYLQCVSAEQQN